MPPFLSVQLFVFKFTNILVVVASCCMNENYLPFAKKYINKYQKTFNGPKTHYKKNSAYW